METSSIYLGIVIVSEDDNGNKSVRYHGKGPDWHELNYDVLVAMEKALMPLGPKYAALGEEADAIMTGVGEWRVAEEAKGKSNK